MKDFNSKKKLTKWQLRELKHFSPYIPFFYCIDIAFIGGSTPTTAFDGAIYKLDTLNIYEGHLESS